MFTANNHGVYQLLYSHSGSSRARYDTSRHCYSTFSVRTMLPANLSAVAAPKRSSRQSSIVSGARGHLATPAARRGRAPRPDLASSGAAQRQRHGLRLVTPPGRPCSLSPRVASPSAVERDSDGKSVVDGCLVRAA